MNEQNSAPSESWEANRAPAYFCRGCGCPLPPSSSDRFHPISRRTNAGGLPTGNNEQCSNFTNGFTVTNVPTVEHTAQYTATGYHPTVEFQAGGGQLIGFEGWRGLLTLPPVNSEGGKSMVGFIDEINRA